LSQTFIRRISFITPAPERARLGAELQQLYAEGKHVEIIARVDACLPKDGKGNFIADQEKSDVVHDLLAFLAERMLEMNKQKQQEFKGFLGWQEGYIGAKVEDLTPKTKLQSYYKHDYEGILTVLKKNKKKLAIDPARREPAEALQVEFEGVDGQTGASATEDSADGRVDRCGGLQAVRSGGRGDRHRGRQRGFEIEVRTTGLSSFTRQSTVNHHVSEPARR